MTDQTLFRQEALDALRSPEQLGRSLRLVRPATRLVLVALGLIIVVAFGAAAFVRVPVMVKGTGVIISSKGMLELTVASQHEGRVAQIVVEEGDVISSGTVVARLVQPGLETELRLARIERESIAQELARVRELQEKVFSVTARLHERQQAEVEDSITFLSERVTALEQLATHLDRLRLNGNITVDRHLQTRADLADARERLANKRNVLISILVEQSEKQAQYEREIQQLETRLAATERQINRLEDRQRNETVVISTHAGTVSEIKVEAGDLVRFDTPVVSLLPTDETLGTERSGPHRLIGLLFVAAQDGKKIRPGMPALVDPTSVRRDVYGTIEGRVTTTSDVPITPERLRRIVRNDDLVRKLTSDGAPFLTTVEMKRSPATPSGYAWTSSQGPSTPLTIGTLAHGDIEVERVSLLGLVIPAIKELLRGPSR
ncbi:NHLP bacteriocin system secretion protein [Microvirga sp. 2TAF3]|uniref:NHLP bacteriocin system secretion protein n=1 Tax=Microvirga sp. 2TAF3 TaxID=3233014 RepID=UPI003F974B6A